MSNLLERLRTEGNPLFEGDNNSEVLFVWEGEDAPYLHLEHQGFEPLTMQRIQPGVWTYPLNLPPDAYVEYYFSTTPQDPSTVVPDPYNNETVPSGVGYDRHGLSMPYRVPTPYTLNKRGVASGTVSQHTITDDRYLHNQTRDVWLYDPSTSDATPLLVVLDGNDYLERGMITTIVDNLIAEEKIRPLSMALIAHAGDYRVQEYNQNETLPMLIDRHILPLANHHLHLLDLEAYRGGYGILGASFGGLAALYTALRMPHVFGTVLSQAGAFWSFNDTQDALIHMLVDTLPKQDINIWMDVGIYDFLFEENQDMRRRLGEKGYDVNYAEHSDGHNYTAWRDILPTALETMYGG